MSITDSTLQNLVNARKEIQGLNATLKAHARRVDKLRRLVDDYRLSEKDPGKLRGLETALYILQGTTGDASDSTYA